MKKLICLVLILAMLFSGCAKWEVEIVDPTKQSESEDEIRESSSEPEEIPKEQPETESKAMIFLAENGKYGIHDENGNVIVEAVYDEIVPSSDPLWSGFEAKFTEGTRPAIEYDEYMTPFLLEEENEKTLLLDENGIPIVEIAFEKYLMENNPSGGEGRWLVGVAEGTNYRFIEEDGKFVLNTEKNREIMMTKKVLDIQSAPIVTIGMRETALGFRLVTKLFSILFITE